jgi:hypothetical protein
MSLFLLPLLGMEEGWQKEGLEEEGENPLPPLQKKEAGPGCPIHFPRNPPRRRQKVLG